MSEFLSDGIILFTHNVSPNRIEFIKNLGNTSFSHFRVKLNRYFFDFFNRCSRNPLIGINFLLNPWSWIHLRSNWLNTESFTQNANSLLTQIPSFLQNISILQLLIITSLPKQAQQFLIISLHIIKLHMNTSFTLSGPVQILDRFF